MERSTINKKIDILRQILLISTGEYYEINLTKDVVPGIMYQVVDGRKYNINEMLGLPESPRFSDVVKKWGQYIPKEEQEDYFSFFAISALLENFERGQDHLLYRYQTYSVIMTPMEAEQHIYMYKNEETGEIWAFTYVLDITEKVKEAEYRNRLEKSSDKLIEERKYLEVLYREYIVAYHIDIKQNEAEVLALHQRSHVWRMRGMWQGAVFDYDKHIKEFEECFITDGNERFRSMLSREYIARRMKTSTRFSFRIECIPNAGGNRNYEIQVVRVNPNLFDGRVIIVSQEIDDAVFAERKRRAELNTERKYLDVLTRDFIAVYHVKLKENISTLIKVDTKIEGYNEEKVILRRENVYSDRVMLYSEKFVITGQKKQFRQVMRAENILSELEKSSRLVYRYQTIQENGVRKFLEVQALRMESAADKSEVLIAFCDIDDVVTAEQRRQLELEKRLERERNQNEVLAALGNSYNTIFKIDIEKNTYEHLRLREEVKRYYGFSEYASEELDNMRRSFVEEAYQKKMESFLDLSTLNERMKEKVSIETEFMTKDGEWRRAGFIVKRRYRDGRISQILYVTRIISTEKNKEERLISIAEAANEANKAKTEFVSKVAHDIRTPMNSLFGFLQIAEANISDREKVEYCLKKIRVAGEFLKELVNDVLDVSKMENGKLGLVPKNISIKELFDEVDGSMQGADFGKDLHFKCDIHNIFCDRVIGDGLRIKQIYTNLLSNAIKYTPNGGGVKLEVYEKEANEPENVILVIKVSDTGIGMSEEFMDKMFQKFERATDTRLNSVGGYGLGLTIVKQLVDMMNGEIEVDSKQGEGTVFKITLKFLRGTMAEEDKSLEGDYKKECEGMYLLVAEDNELSREVMSELLAHNGIKCDVASDGAECFEMFKNSQGEKYDAVLMDMQMPKVNGVSSAKMIRELDFEKAKSVPIIAMTANALNSDVMECLAAGMNMHLSKPVDINELLKALANFKKR